MDMEKEFLPCSALTLIITHGACAKILVVSLKPSYPFKQLKRVSLIVTGLVF